jgi:2-polyprenyl-3-methyl-5-hydroxy-6-metoxy-1,4-benzoquinol methylase
MTSTTVVTNPSLASAYDDKPSSYFQGARHDIIADLPRSPELAILEVGCGTGSTLVLAKRQNKAGLTVGVELDRASAATAREHIDMVVEGNIETVDLPFSPAQFDVLIMSEVLEHLVDPWTTLRKLRPFLKVGGLLYVSSPNVAHIFVLRQLLRNRFDYKDSGITDWTHLRWFTPATYREMIEGAGFRTHWARAVSPPTPKQRIANALTLGLLSHIFVAQIFVKAERAG